MVGWMLAHQGGWDELLLVFGPVAVFAALLWVANRRAGRLGPAGTGAEGDTGPKRSDDVGGADGAAGTER